MSSAPDMLGGNTPSLTVNTIGRVLAAGLAYGVGMWVFAMVIMDRVIGGAPALLGFQGLTWASLVGHLAMGAAIG